MLKAIVKAIFMDVPPPNAQRSHAGPVLRDTHRDGLPALAAATGIMDFVGGV